MSIILSTFKDHKLTDRQHSAVFYAIGLSNATVNGYGNNLQVATDINNKNKVGVQTGIGFIKGRMFEITEPELFDIQPNHYFRLYVLFDGMTGTIKVKFEQSSTTEFIPPFDDGDNIQQNPRGVAMYTLGCGYIEENTDELKYNNFNNYFSISKILDEMVDIENKMVNIENQMFEIEKESEEVNNLLQEVTDKLKKQNEATDELKEKINVLEEDTGWVDIHFASGFNGINSNAKIRRIGHQVFLNGLVYINSGFIANKAVFGYVPEGFIPSGPETHIQIVGGTGSYVAKIYIDIKDGKMALMFSSGSMDHISLSGITYSI